MRKKYIYCVRLVGSPLNRRYIVQRSDGVFWGGAAKWVADQHKALVYRTITDAQAACRPFMDRQKRGKPRRQFTCSLTVNVFGHDTGPITAQEVAAYLTKVMTLGIDYEQLHQGPVAEHLVEVVARLGGMVEVTPTVAVRK